MNLDQVELLKAVLHLAIGSTIVLTTGLATTIACRRQSSATRHLAGALTCVALLVLPVTAVTFPSWRLGLVHIASIPAASSATPVSAPVFTESATPNETHASSTSTEFVAASRSAESHIQSSSTIEPGPEARTDAPFVRYFVGFYLLGVACGFTRLITDHLWARRLRKSSTEFAHDEFVDPVASDQKSGGRRRTSIRASEHISIPMATGLLRPTVLLPSAANAWPADRVRAAVAHERAHIERHDLAVQLVTKIVAIIYWPQPLVHLLVSTMRSYRESACDDQAVTDGQRPTQYAQHLLSIAADLRGQRHDGAGALAMARTSKFEKRIKAVLSRSRRRTPPTRRAIVLVLVTILASLLGSAWTSPYAQFNSVAAAQEESGVDAQAAVEPGENDHESDAFIASGRVIDASGNPIAGALVVAPAYGDEWNPTNVTQITNDQGEFRVVYPPSQRDNTGFHTWVYAEGHAMRVVMMRTRFGQSRRAEKVEIQLPKPEPRAYRVLLPDGAPCANALVGPYLVEWPNGVFAADEPTGLMGPVPEEMFQRLARRTNDDGEVRLDSVPAALLDSTLVTTAEYGKQVFAAEYDELRLSPAGAIRGGVSVESPKRFAGMKVMLQTEHNNGAPPEKRRSGIAVAELDEQGEFHVPVIAAGYLSQIVLKWDDQADVQPVLPHNRPRSVSSNETLNLSIETRPAATLHGQVLFEDTREPVVNGRVYMWNLESLTNGSSVNTDEQGRYLIRVPAGEIHRQLVSLGSSGSANLYDYPRLENLSVSSDRRSVELEPILVPRKRIVRGKLQNASGEPIGGRTVVLHTGSFRHLAGQAETDADGNFEMAVRDWKILRDVPRVRKRIYWAVVDKPAVGTAGPVLTRLKEVSEDSQAVILTMPQ